MNIFGWKKKQAAAAPAPPAASASTASPTVTIAKLRETIQQQEKRYVELLCRAGYERYSKFFPYNMLTDFFSFQNQ